MSSDYSEKEMQLIKRMGFEDEARRYNAYEVFRRMSIKAFVSNMQGPAVESLRRCMYYLDHPEEAEDSQEWWDNLIRL